MGKKLASTGVDAGNRFEVVLGGGGVRGYGHLGFLNAIEEAGFVVPVYTGVSVGSIVAAFYTNGYSPAEIAEIDLAVFEKLENNADTDEIPDRPEIAIE